MNHKRGRPKSKRAGCLFCKPHKHERSAKRPRSKRALAILAESIATLVVVLGCAPSYPPLPPPTGPGDCATSTANLRTLGGCGRNLETFEQHCREAESVEAPKGIRFPNACITAAKTCDAAEMCK